MTTTSRRYSPGATPPGPGLFLRFDVPAHRLPAALARLGAAGDAYERRRRRALRLAPLLLAAAVTALLSDLVAADGARLYAWFAPALAAAVPLVAWAAAPEPGRLRAVLAPLHTSLVGLAVMVAFPAAFVGLVVLLEGGGAPRWLRLTGLLLVTTLAPLLVLMSGRARELRELGTRVRDVWRAAPSWRGARAALAPLAESLAGLAAPGTRIAGFIDLTGAERAWKELRLPPRPDRPCRRLYRDEWAHLDLTLRSGARLRLRASEILNRYAPTAPLSADTDRRSLHTLVACLWPARLTPDGDTGAAGPRREEPHGHVLRVEHGARRRLVELRLEDRALAAGALSDALERLEPGAGPARSSR